MSLFFPSLDLKRFSFLFIQKNVCLQTTSFCKNQWLVYLKVEPSLFTTALPAFRQLTRSEMRARRWCSDRGTRKATRKQRREEAGSGAAGTPHRTRWWKVVVCGGGEKKDLPPPAPLQHTCCRGAAEQQDVCVGGCDFFADSACSSVLTPRTCSSTSVCWSHVRSIVSDVLFLKLVPRANNSSGWGTEQQGGHFAFYVSQLTTKEDQALRGLFILRPETLQHSVLYFSDVFLSNIYIF